MRLNAFNWLAYILVIVGALNWGLVGLFSLDLVQLLFGSIPILATTVYALVGVAGLYLVYMLATRTSRGLERAS